LGLLNNTTYFATLILVRQKDVTSGNFSPVAALARAETAHAMIMFYVDLRFVIFEACSCNFVSTGSKQMRKGNNNFEYNYSTIKVAISIL